MTRLAAPVAVRALLPLLVSLLGAGCASWQAGEREPFAELTAVPIDAPRVVALEEALEATARDRQTLVGAADVALSSPEFGFSRPQRIAIARPASLRVEILGLSLIHI